MKIVLSGDVHNWINNKEQRYMSTHLWIADEISVLKQRLDIAQEYNVSTTLFLTWLFAKKNKDVLRLLYQAANGLIEFSWHTYTAFHPTWFFAILKWLSWFRYRYWPGWYQKIDIRLTLKAIKDIIDKDSVSWRTHEYNMDQNTVEILASQGIKIISDWYEPVFSTTFKDWIYYQPINTLPDHENIVHYSHTSCKDHAIDVKDWLKEIKQVILDHKDTESNIVILAHPTCMLLSDNFETFRELCEFIGQFQTVCMKDIYLTNS